MTVTGRPLAVTAFFAQLGVLFVQGRLAEMTGFWSFPCPVEVGGRLVVMRDPPMLRDYFARRHDQAQVDGLTAMIPRIAAIEMPRQGRFRVWLRWQYEFADLCVPDDAASLYYMARSAGGGLSIEMMDLVRLPPVSARAMLTA